MADLQASARDAFANGLGMRSRRAYGTGERHWDAFRQEFLTPDFGQGGDDEGNASAFLVYLVDVVGVSPQTANCYLSHAIRRTVGARGIVDNTAIRTNFTKGVLRGLSRSHDRSHPVRDRTRVPLTYSLVVTAVDVINGLFGNPSNRIVMHAALAVAYGLSLRPGEYLAMSGNAERALDEQALAGAAYLWWNGKAYSICDPHNFPPGPADTFTLLVDFLKQDQSGKGMPRAVARPTTAVPFCCVGAIETYARSRQLKRTDPLLMMGEHQLKWDAFRFLTCALARKVGLDPARLIVHSGRYGAPNQIVAHGFARDVVMVQGGWASEGGAGAYLMPSLNHAKLVADAIHDQDAIPVPYLAHAFNAGKQVGGNASVDPLTS